MDEKTKAQKGREHSVLWARLDFVFIQLMIKHLPCVSPDVGIRIQPWIRQMRLLISQSRGSKLVGSGREQSTKHINQLTSHRNKFPNPLSQVSSSPSLPPHHAAIFSGGKLSASSTCRGWGGSKVPPSKNPQTASPLSLCLLSSRSHGHRQWLGEAVLAKVPRDPDGGEVQYIPFRGWHLCPTLDLSEPQCLSGVWRFGRWVSDEWDRYKGTRLTFKVKWDWIPTSLIYLFYMS